MPTTDRDNPGERGMEMQVRSGVTSQATDVEKARAVAHVQAAYTIADARPRTERLAREHMLETCGRYAMAERAFYDFPRAGGRVRGLTVHIARELARVWRNVQYGKAELRRDMDRHESEMLAYAVDLETNTRVETTFLVPHLREKQGRTGGELLHEPREIYELLANMGARREREMILAVLPTWFADEASRTCRQTLETGGEGAKPLAERIGVMLDLYQSRYRVTPARLALELGKPESSWEGRDLAGLAVTYRSLEDGVITVEQAFPSAVVTPEAIAAQAATPRTATEGER